MVMRGAGEYDIINSICQSISPIKVNYICVGYGLVDCNPKFVLNTYVFDKLGTGQAKSGFVVPYSERITDFFGKVAKVHPRRPAHWSNIPITNRNAPLVLHLLCRKWSLMRWKLWMKRSILVFAMVSYLPPPTIHRLILGGV